MTYHFYFKNSEPVYETEYMQSLKQFAEQEVFPTYVLKDLKICTLFRHKIQISFCYYFHIVNLVIFVSLVYM